MPSVVGSIPDIETGPLTRYFTLARERGVKPGREGLDYSQLLYQLLLAGLEKV